MTSSSGLDVKSHVGRDLLASAAAFKTEAAAVWEYVVNSLQYVDSGVTPKIHVGVRPSEKCIFIRDNGRGLTSEDLEHFFTMHGENKERRAGRGGRGKWGTGKSAAFGIARVLRVDTVRGGLRNVAELSRDMIDQSDGASVPVDLKIQDEETDAPNGTTISIEDIVLPRIRTTPIIEYIERHLQAFRPIAPEVAVNSHVCEYREPEIGSTVVCKPTAEQAEILGDIELVIKVALAPLPEVEQGVAVFSGVGNLVAIERGGVQTKDFGGYLFGEVNVPVLETAETPLAPFDSSRSLQLNPQHPVAAKLMGFVGSKLDAVRRQLVQKERDAKQTEQARRLEREAEKIAEILNDDFNKIRQRLQEIRSASVRTGSAGASFGGAREAGSDLDSWVRGTQAVGTVEEGDRSRRAGGGGKGRRDPNVTPRGEPDPDGVSALDAVGGSGKKRSRPRGGFSVQYRNLGKSEERSRYESASLSILINLDHSVLKAALGDGKVEDPAFRRLSYEIAFSEYAMGLGYEIISQDPNIPADDLLYEVRSSLHRLATAAAVLYR